MAIRINRVYTRTGDAGRTHLVGGAEVAKDSLRIEAFGAVDELNSVLGLARVFNEQASTGGLLPEGSPGQAAARELDGVLTCLQNELFDLGSELATPPEAEYPGMVRIGDAEVTALERRIDRCQADLAPLQSFVLPGGGPVGGFLHQARTVCRRAEREVLRLAAEEAIGSGPQKYLNRLSDLLFVLSRWIALQTGEREYIWGRGLHLGESGEKPSRRSPRGGQRATVATPRKERASDS